MKIHKKGKLLLGLTLVIFVMMMISPGMSTMARLDSKAVFDNVGQMTTEEIVAEMKYAVRTNKEGKYYPQGRLHALERQLAKNQTAEIERFKKQLKQDAEIAKEVERLKAKAIAKAKEKGQPYVDEYKEKIKAEVEDQVRRSFNMSKEAWEQKKSEFNDMYEEGSKVYDEKVAGYVEAAEKAYAAYSAYHNAKNNHPEAPEAAQNLVGFLNATGEVLNYAGDKMDKTPLRPIGEILKMYGAATGLGDTAAKTAWIYTHREGINPNVQSQYTKGLSEVHLGDFDFSGINKSDLMTFNKNLRVLQLADGTYAAFNDKFELIPGAHGKTLTAAEYQKLEELYVAFSNGKEEGWPDLNVEQLVKLVRGEKVNITVNDRMFTRFDEIKEFASESIMAMGEKHADSTIRSDMFTSLERLIYGDQTLWNATVGRFTRLSRLRELWDLFSEYSKTTDPENSLIHDREAFLEWVKEIKEGNKGLSPEELKDKIREMIKKIQEGDNNGEEENGGSDGEDNPLEEALGEIDPELTGADASGVTTGDDEGNEGGHWTQNTPEDFNGQKDGGFTNTGGTNRPMPGGTDPRSIDIDVLKPNIYLYPRERQEVTVTFKSPQRLTKVIPIYEDYWSVMVEPDGRIDEIYTFLFYEASVNRLYFQTSVGWLLPSNQREEVFAKILNQYGFNLREQKDFVEFWNERLDSGVTYYMYPQETTVIDQVMSIDVEPLPDNYHRIWFYFIPVNAMNIANAVTEPKNMEEINRSGDFILVEWGGMVEEN